MKSSKKTFIIYNLRRGFISALAVMFTCILLLSISSKNTVGMTIALLGHPRTALQTKPVHSNEASSALKANIYTIPMKDSFSGVGISHISLFEVHSILIFHIAIPTYDHLA